MNNEAENLIDEIVELSGVPVLLVEAARERLRSLEPANLSPKLERLRSDSDALRNWREKRSAVETLKSNRIISSSIPLNRSLSPARFEQEVSAMIEEVGRIISRRCGVALPPKALSSATKYHKRSRRAYSHFLAKKMTLKNIYEQLTLIERISRKEIEGLMEARGYMPQRHPSLSPSSRSIALTEYIEGMSRIENEIILRPPAAIVALNQGGYGVSRFISHNLKLDIPIIKVKTDQESIYWSEVPDVQSNQIVCVVGDVTRSGKTMRRAMEETKDIFSTNKTYGAALIASRESVELALENSDFIYHHIIEANDMNLNVDYIDFNYEPREYQVLDSIDHAEAVIDERLIESTRKILRERFPTQKLSWEIGGK